MRFNSSFSKKNQNKLYFELIHTINRYDLKMKKDKYLNRIVFYCHYVNKDFSIARLDMFKIMMNGIIEKYLEVKDENIIYKGSFEECEEYVKKCSINLSKYREINKEVSLSKFDDEHMVTSNLRETIHDLLDFWEQQ